MTGRAWVAVRLGDYCSKIGSGSTPRGGDSVYQESGVSLIRSQNVYNGQFAMDGLAHLDDKHADQLKGVTVEPGDVLLNITGDSVARSCRVPDDVLPARVNQHVAIIRPKPEEFDARFVGYFFISPFMQDTMLSLAGSGGTRKALTKEMVERFEVPRPPRPVQERIADILSAYDDLIENNRRRMALLEDAARQLYREWFVRLRFPGHEHTSVTNGVPEGWERVPLFDVAVPTYGHPFQSPLFTEDVEGLPVVRIRDVLAGESKTFTPEAAPPDRRLQNGDMLIGMDGDFHMGLWAGGEAWLNQRVVRIKSKGAVEDYLLFNLLREPIRTLNETITGTTVVHLGAKELKEIQLLLPPGALLALANDWFEPLGKQVVSLKLQNRQLRAARDLLLPRLMSGEIAV